MSSLTESRANVPSERRALQFTRIVPGALLTGAFAALTTEVIAWFAVTGLGVSRDFTPLSPTKEVLVPADTAIAAYRDWLRKFDDMGWRLDLPGFKKRQGVHKAYAIPSPARRASGNWGAEELPTLESRAPAMPMMSSSVARRSPWAFWP